ncbi:MAG: amino acid ABC transporter ATP-binding protein [Pirellulaceae bacterium]
MSAPQGVVFRDVTKRYGTRVILNRINLTIAPGEIVALIGPSGGGKSTLLRCINGLNTFDEGEITVGPYRLVAQAPSDDLQAIRRTYGMIFQDFQLFPHLTALQNVMEAPLRVLQQPRAVVRARAQELLDRMGLGERQDAYPRQLSGGQKQRVAIARALSMEPRGLLCDEITSALDPELKGEVLDAVLGLRNEGLTIIMVTHEIHFARRAADRVVVLADGIIVEEGPPEKVLESPQTPRTQRFLSQVLA